MVRRREKELESKVRKPAEAEKYRLEKIGRRIIHLFLSINHNK